MAVDPVGATLASIGVFIQFYNICDTLVHGYKLTLQFGDDFSAVQRELDMQWARLHLLMRSRRFLKSEIDPENRNSTMSTTIANYLGQMQRYFQICHDLMKKYNGEDQHGPYLACNTSASMTGAGGLTPSASSDTTLVSSQANSRPVKPSGWHKINVFRKPKKSVSPQPDIKRKSKKKAVDVKVPDLNIQEVQDAAAAAEQEALRYQEKANFWRRSRWAKRDKDDLKAALGQLRQGNNNLESILRLLALKNPSLALPSSGRADSLWPLVTRISKTLGVLHQNLMILNVKRDGHAPYFLSLRLSEDHQKSRRELGDYVSLRDGSQVFNLQRQLTDQTGEASKLLLVQSFQQEQKPSEQTVPDSLPRLETIDRPIHVQNIPHVDDIERWGSFGNSDENDYSHIIYHDNDNDWTCTNTLRDVLSANEFREYITPVQVVQLAKILLCSYLYLESIYGGTKVPRPLNYCFYKTSDEEDMWDRNNPRVLRPWLSFGFGRRPAKAKLGGGSGVADSGGSAMVELGLLLHQIGTGIAIDYATGLSQARAEALGSLHALELRMGLIYAEMVENFLEFEARPSYLLAPDDGHQQTEYVKRVISALMKLEHDFVDTAIAPMMMMMMIEPDPVPELQLSDVLSATVSKENLVPLIGATTPGPPSIATSA